MLAWKKSGYFYRVDFTGHPSNQFSGYRLNGRLFLFFGPMCEHKNTKLQLSTTTRKKGWIMICVKKTCALISKGSWYIQGGYKWYKGIKKEHFFASYMIMYIIYLYTQNHHVKTTFMLTNHRSKRKKKFLISAWRSLGHYNRPFNLYPENWFEGYPVRFTL